MIALQFQNITVQSAKIELGLYKQESTNKLTVTFTGDATQTIPTVSEGEILLYINSYSFALTQDQLNYFGDGKQHTITRTCDDGRSKLSCNETFIGIYQTSSKTFSVKVQDVLEITLKGGEVSVVGDEFVKPSDFPWYIVYICAAVVGVIVLIIVITCIGSCIKRRHQEKANEIAAQQAAASQARPALVPAQENGTQQTQAQAVPEQRITKEYIQRWGYENMKAMTDFKSKEAKEEQTKWMDNISELSGKYAQTPVSMQLLATNYSSRISLQTIPRKLETRDGDTSIAEEPVTSMSTSAMSPLSTMGSLNPGMMGTYRSQTQYPVSNFPQTDPLQAIQHPSGAMTMPIVAQRSQQFIPVNP